MKIPSLVSVQWLAQALLKHNKASRSLRVIDATWRLEDGSVEAHEDYFDSHIPGAVFFDIDECCDKSNKFPHMLPDEKLFAEYVQHLGITNDSHVIAYDNNKDFGLFSSPRLWWTFRCFGHGAISVLNGGFRKWLDAGLPVESGDEEPVKVSVRWLAQALLKSKTSRPLRVVEAILGGNNPVQSREDYLNGHIPGAVCFDIDECCDKSNKFPHMLPDEKLFAEYVQHLGITNDSHVIAYENNKDFGLYRSPRLWWMFRCFGHDTTSVLDGGFSKWLSAGLPMETGEKQVVNTNQPFISKLNKDLVRDYETMVANVQSGGSMYQVVDARGKARFDGEGEFRPGISSGHIPHSLNVPFVECLDKESQLMKDPERLKQVFAERGVDLNRPITTTCGSGVTASVLALAAHQCGRKDVGVYDGSWAEWGRRAPPDMVEKN